jgi:hypothetical protein
MAKKVIKKVSKPAAAKKVVAKAAPAKAKKVVAKKVAPAKAKKVITKKAAAPKKTVAKKAPAKAKAKKATPSGKLTVTGKTFSTQNKGLRDIIRSMIKRKSGATIAQMRDKLDAELGAKGYSDSTIGTTLSIINRNVLGQEVDNGHFDNKKNKAGETIYRFIKD